MKYHTFWRVLLIAFSCAASASTNIEIIVTPSSTVSPNNRAAHFNWLVESESGAEAQIGQFACGSYWVAPALGENGVRVLSLSGSGNPDQTDLLALDSNPRPHSHGLLGLGSQTYGSHNPEENDEPKLPLSYSASSGSAVSLVAAMQRNELETSGGGTKSIQGGAMDAYCILTILAEVPANGGNDMIRPNIVGDAKELLTWDDFDLSRLPAHAFIPGSTPESINAQRVQWNHSTEIFSMKTWDGSTFSTYSEGGRAFRPHILHHNYAAGRAASINNSMISMLGGNNSLEEKKPLIASLIAQGLDTWHFMYGRTGFSGAWSSGAGQWGGQFAAPVFAVSLLHDPTKSKRLMQVAADNITSNSTERSPLEMRQIMRGNTGVLLWGDGHEPSLESTTSLSSQARRYWNDLKWADCYINADGSCNPNVGKKTTADPHGFIDGPAAKPGSGYMGIAAGNQRGLAALMILFPEFRKVVNSDDIIEFTDRVNRAGIWSSPDPVATISDPDRAGCNIWSAPYTGIDCESYQTEWGPRLDDTRYAIENGIGRFTGIHGTSLGIVYTSSKAESHWDTIIAMYDGKRWENTFSGLNRCVAPDIVISPQNGNTVYMRSGTTDAEIRYSLDGSVPNESSLLYNGPFEIETINAVKAIALKPDLQNSKISSNLPIDSTRSAPPTPSNLGIIQ
jgi:hypothetical protein